MEPIICPQPRCPRVLWTMGRMSRGPSQEVQPWLQSGRNVLFTRHNSGDAFPHASYLIFCFTPHLWDSHSFSQLPAGPGPACRPASSPPAVIVYLSVVACFETKTGLSRALYRRTSCWGTSHLSASHKPRPTQASCVSGASSTVDSVIQAASAELEDSRQWLARPAP